MQQHFQTSKGGNEQAIRYLPFVYIVRKVVSTLNYYFVKWEFLKMMLMWNSAQCRLQPLLLLRN